METLEQLRSKAAWAAATKQVTALGNEFKDYKNNTKSAPMMIMNSGLMATLAFYQSRGKKPADALVTDLIMWIATRKTLEYPEAPAITTRDPFQQMMSRLLNAPSAVYQQATTETLAYLRWLRQFADAVDTQSTPKQ